MLHLERLRVENASRIIGGNARFREKTTPVLTRLRVKLEGSPVWTRGLLAESLGAKCTPNHLLLVQDNRSRLVPSSIHRRVLLDIGILAYCHV